MTLNPFKTIRQLKAIIGTLQTLIGSLNKVIEGQTKLIAILRSQIELQAMRDQHTVAGGEPGPYVN